MTTRGRDAARSHVLPAGLSDEKPPDWPFGTPSAAERALWKDLWSRPVASLWRSELIAPIVPARYVKTLVDNPSHPSLVAMESALGLTPASLNRLGVTFSTPGPHLSVEAEDVLAKRRARKAGAA